MIVVNFEQLPSDSAIAAAFRDFLSRSLSAASQHQLIKDLEAFKHNQRLFSLCLYQHQHSQDASIRRLCCVLLKNYCAELEKSTSDISYAYDSVAGVVAAFQRDSSNRQLLQDTLLSIFRASSLSDCLQLIHAFAYDCDERNFVNLSLSSHLVSIYCSKYELSAASDSLFLEIIEVSNLLCPPLIKLLSSLDDISLGTHDQASTWAHVLGILRGLFYHDIPEVFMEFLKVIFAFLDRIASLIFSSSEDMKLLGPFSKLLRMILLKYHEDIPNLQVFAGYLIRLLASKEKLEEVEEDMLGDFVFLLDQLFRRDEISTSDFDMAKLLQDVLCPLLVPTSSELEFAEDCPDAYVRSILEVDVVSKADAVTSLFVTIAKKLNLGAATLDALFARFDPSNENERIALLRLVVTLLTEGYVDVAASVKLVEPLCSTVRPNSLLSVQLMAFFVKTSTKVCSRANYTVEKLPVASRNNFLQLICSNLLSGGELSTTMACLAVCRLLEINSDELMNLLLPNIPQVCLHLYQTLTLHPGKFENSVVALALCNIVLASSQSSNINALVLQLLSACMELSRQIFSGSSQGSFCYFFGCLLGACIVTSSARSDSVVFQSLCDLLKVANTENWSLIFQLLTLFDEANSSLVSIISVPDFWSSTEFAKHAAIYYSHLLALSTISDLDAPLRVAEKLMQSQKTQSYAVYILLPLLWQRPLEDSRGYLISLLTVFQKTRSDGVARAVILLISCLHAKFQESLFPLISSIQGNLLQMLLSLLAKHCGTWAHSPRELLAIVETLSHMLTHILSSRYPVEQELTYFAFKAAAVAVLTHRDVGSSTFAKMDSASRGLSDIQFLPTLTPYICRLSSTFETIGNHLVTSPALYPLQQRMQQCDPAIWSQIIRFK